MSATLKISSLPPQAQPLLTIVVLCVFLCSCATPFSTSTNRYFPVTNRNIRANSLGFSITPPSGAGWYEKLDDKSLYYLKKVERDDYAIYTKATEIHLKISALEIGKFLEYVKNAKKLDTTSGHYRNISFNLIVDKNLSPLCVRYIQDYDDYGKGSLENDNFIRVQKSGLMCMHPESPENGVDMFYRESFRHPHPHRDQSHKDEGEFFLSSLRFHAPDGG